MCLTTWRHPTSPFILTKKVNKIKNFIKIILYVIIYRITNLSPGERKIMAKHKSWHGADRKRALKAKQKIAKRREAKRRERLAAQAKVASATV